MLFICVQKGRIQRTWHVPSVTELVNTIQTQGTNYDDPGNKEKSVTTAIFEGESRKHLQSTEGEYQHQPDFLRLGQMQPR